MQSGRTTIQAPLFQSGPVPDTVHGAVHGAVHNPAGANGHDAGRELTLALRRHDGPAVREWLRHAPTAVHWRDELGNTPLHTAIQSRCEPDLINALLAHRADPAIANRDGDTCMHLAMGLRPTMPAVVQSLLDQGRWFGGGIGFGALGKPNRHGRTALELGRDVGGAPAIGHAAILPALESALVDWMNGFRTSVLAGIEADDAAAVRHLVTSADWSLDMPINDGLDMLQLALRNEAPRVACSLIDLAVAVDNRAVLEQADAGLGMTPLMTAVAAGADAPFARLLLHGVPVDAQGPLGITALHLAAASGQPRAVQQLVAYGANPGCPRPVRHHADDDGSVGWTPGHRQELARCRRQHQRPRCAGTHPADVRAPGRPAAGLHIQDHHGGGADRHGGRQGRDRQGLSARKQYPSRE